jgi:hypothetical protein
LVKEAPLMKTPRFPNLKFETPTTKAGSSRHLPSGSRPPL